MVLEVTASSLPGAISTDTRPHPHFRRYSDGNFVEVAPARLSPLAWSAIGPPMERGFRKIYASVIPRLRPLYETREHAFVGYFCGKPYHNISGILCAGPFIPWFKTEDTLKDYFQGISSKGFHTNRTESWVNKTATTTRAFRRLTSLDSRLHKAENLLTSAEELVAAGRTLDQTWLPTLRDVVNATWESHVETTVLASVLLSWTSQAGSRFFSDVWEISKRIYEGPSNVVWSSMRPVEGLASTEFLSSSYYEIGSDDPAWQTLEIDIPGVSSLNPTIGQHEAQDVDERFLDVVGHYLSPTQKTLMGVLGRQTRLLLFDRERSKALAMRSLRMAIKAIQNADLTETVEAWSCCTLEELAARRVSESVTRLEEIRRYAQVELPGLVDLQGSGQPTRAVESLQMGVSPGVASGPAFYAGEVIPDKGVYVCESADSRDLSQIESAAAVVCEKGSRLSHIAIICRSLSIPAVVNVDNATNRFRSGERLYVDGSLGVVSTNL